MREEKRKKKGAELGEGQRKKFVCIRSNYVPDHVTRKKKQKKSIERHLHCIYTMANPNCIAHAMQALRLSPRSLSCSPHLSILSSTHLPRSRRHTRTYSTDTTEAPAAPEIDFSKFQNHPARIVPASPAYFSGNPRFIDELLKLEAMQAKYASLPTVAPSEAPRMAWLKLVQFRNLIGEAVPMKKYKSLVKILQRLNCIHPDIIPDEVRNMLNSFLRPGNPYAAQKGVSQPVDEYGRVRAKGKRKESHAVVYLVEGEGEVLVNGKSLVEVFQRVHDRESALWALRCTQRTDKYNAWVTVHGGGVTGQAEAITLAIGRALMTHEPGLKPTLRKGRFFTSSMLFAFADVFASWCYHGRCPSCREEETGSAQGSQDAHLGQAVKDRNLSSRFLLFHLSTLVLYPVLNA